MIIIICFIYNIYIRPWKCKWLNRDKYREYIFMIIKIRDHFLFFSIFFFVFFGSDPMIISDFPSSTFRNHSWQWPCNECLKITKEPKGFQLRHPPPMDWRILINIFTTKNDVSEKNDVFIFVLKIWVMMFKSHGFLLNYGRWKYFAHNNLVLSQARPR